MTTHRSHHLLCLAALAGLVGVCYRSVACVHRTRLQKRPQAEPQHIQTWEGEGGGVPVTEHRTAAQVEPTGDPSRPV
jgi:hypothetical protein